MPLANPEPEASGVYASSCHAASAPVELINNLVVTWTILPHSGCAHRHCMPPEYYLEDSGGGLNEQQLEADGTVTLVSKLFIIYLSIDVLHRPVHLSAGIM